MYGSGRDGLPLTGSTVLRLRLSEALENVRPFSHRALGALDLGTSERSGSALLASLCSGLKVKRPRLEATFLLLGGSFWVSDFGVSGSLVHLPYASEDLVVRALHPLRTQYYRPWNPIGLVRPQLSDLSDPIMPCVGKKILGGRYLPFA